MNKIIKDLLINVKKEKLLSVSNIFILTLTFLLLGIFITVFAYSQTAVKILEQQAQITVFFKDDFPEDKILELKNNLSQDGRVSNVRYVSKQEAFQIFMDMNKDEPILLESASASILPASLEIQTKHLGSLSEISSEFSAVDGVEDVKFFRDVIDNLRYWSTVILAGSGALLAIFIFISYSLVLNTLRTTINNKGTELEILKLVGASDEYVKSPLIAQGMFFGGVSAFAASILITLFLSLANLAKILPVPIRVSGLIIPTLQIHPAVFIILLMIILISSGAALGYFGSSSAIKKYLNY